MPPSRKSTSASSRTKAAPEAPPQAEASLTGVDEVSSVDEALEAVQTDLVGEKDGRREERWCWLAVVTVMFDVISFKDMGNWVAPVSLVILEVIVLIVLGRKWGIDPIWTLTERVINKWTGKIRG